MFTIARLTFSEMLNKRILLLGIVLTILYLGLFGLGLHYLEKQMRDSVELVRMALAGELLTAGLFVSGMMVSAITIFCSVGIISSEIDNGIMLATAAKPLSRLQIFLGKYLGLSLPLVGYSLLVFVATNMIVWGIFRFYSYGFLIAMAVFALQPLVLLAVSLWGSTFLNPLGNGIFMFILYSVSLVGGVVEYVGVQMSTVSATASAGVASSLTILGILTSLLMPVDSLYRTVNFTLLFGSSLPSQPLALNPFSTTIPASTGMLAYAAGYVLFFVGLGIYSFSRRDI